MAVIYRVILCSFHDIVVIGKIFVVYEHQLWLLGKEGGMPVSIMISDTFSLCAANKAQIEHR